MTKTDVARDPREREGEYLNLTAYDLQAILTQLERAQQAKIRFEGALIAGQHRVHVHWRAAADQRDEEQLVITRITRV